MKKRLFLIFLSLLILIPSVFLSCKVEVEPVQLKVTITSTEGQIYNKELNVFGGYKLTREDLPILECETKDFIGWFIDSMPVNEGHIVTDNITITAWWRNKDTASKDIKVTLKSSEGQLYEKSIYVSKGYKLTEQDLVSLSNKNDKFLGWYLNDKKVEVGYEVTTDITLIAKWEIVEKPSEDLFKVSFKSTQSQLYDESIFVPKGYKLTTDDLATLSNEKDKFLGWYLNDEKVEVGYEVNADIILQAKWEIVDKPSDNLRKITWKSYEETLCDKSTFVPTGYKLTSKDLEALSSDKIQFLGWYFNDEKIEVGYEVTTDITLIAQWYNKEVVNNKLKVTWKSFDGELYEKSIYVPYGYTLDYNDFPSLHNSGDTFLGWYVNEEEVFSGYKITGNTVLLAKWDLAPGNRPSENKRRLSWLSLDNTLCDKSGFVDVGYTITEQDLTPLKSDKIDFIGWYLNGNKAKIGDVVTEDTVLIAKWNQNTIKPDYRDRVNITWISTDGLMYKKNRSVPKGYKLTRKDLEPLNNPNCTFDDWYMFDVSISKGFCCETDITLVAKWYKLTDNKPKGYWVSEENVFYRRDVEDVDVVPSDLVDLSFDNHKMIGWFIGDKKIESGDILDLHYEKTLQIKAKWKDEVPSNDPNKITLNWSSDECEVLNKNQIERKGYELTEEDLTPLFYDKYNFLGWYINNEKLEVGRVINSNVSIQAKWEKIIPEDSSDIVAPDEVTNLKVNINYGKCLVRWDNPISDDLYGIDITISNERYGKRNYRLDKSLSAYMFKGFAQNEDYIFTVRTFDKNYNYSRGISITTHNIESYHGGFVEYNKKLEFNEYDGIAKMRVEDGTGVVVINTSPSHTTEENNLIKSPIVIVIDKRINDYEVGKFVGGVNYYLSCNIYSQNLRYCDKKSYQLYIPSRRDVIPENVIDCKAVGKNNSVLLTWKYPPDPNIDYLRIKVENPSNSQRYTIEVPKDTTSYFLDDIEQDPSSSPTFYLSTVTKDNRTSSEIKVSTEWINDNPRPGDITNLKVQIIGNTATLTWDNPIDDDLYALEIYGNSSTFLVSPDTSSYVFPKLDYNHEYNFRVTAIDTSKNRGKVSSITAFTGIDEKTNIYLWNADTYETIKDEIDYGEDIKVVCNSKDIKISYAINSEDYQNIYSYISYPKNEKDGFTLNLKLTPLDKNKAIYISKYLKVKKYSVKFNNHLFSPVSKTINNLVKGDVLTDNILRIIQDNYDEVGRKFLCWRDQYGDIVSPGIEICKDLVLTAEYEDLDPTSILNWSLNVTKNSLTLNWENPVIADLNYIKISGDNGIDDVILAKNTTSYTLNNLKPDTVYNIVINTVDLNGNIDEGVIIHTNTFEPIPFTPTNSVKKLDKIYLDTDIKIWDRSPNQWESRIVKYQNFYECFEYGDWPQSRYKGNENLLYACNSVQNFNNCFTDGNGNYYVKLDYNLSNGVLVYDYFKIEPITWTNLYPKQKIISSIGVDLNKYTPEEPPLKLYSDKVLGCMAYSSFTKNFIDSELHAFLNDTTFKEPNFSDNDYYVGNGFKSHAFSAESIQNIQDVSINGTGYYYESIFTLTPHDGCRGIPSDYALASGYNYLIWENNTPFNGGYDDSYSKRDDITNNTVGYRPIVRLINNNYVTKEK